MTTTLKRFVAVRKKLQRERTDLVLRLRQIDILLSRIRILVEAKDSAPAEPRTCEQAVAQ